MRFLSAIAATALLLAPSVLADRPEGDWSGETTITLYDSATTTLTVTKTMYFANATASDTAKPTGWNATASGSLYTPTVSSASLTATAPLIASATGAADANKVNLAVAVLAGAAAMAWGSL